MRRFVAMCLLLSPFHAAYSADPQESPQATASSENGREPAYVSRTFQDIQDRVITRDPETKAILRVRTAFDAPAVTELSFKIIPIPADHLAVYRGLLGETKGLIEIPHDGEAIVTLSREDSPGKGIYEQYRLRLDDALREELKNQERYQQLRRERQIEGLKKITEDIERLSGGKLRYGMTVGEVEAIKGKPLKVNIWMQAGSFDLIYQDIQLNFHMSRLSHIRAVPVTPKPTEEFR
ncbi:hypothetical protein SH661x_000347 [Planctomicrobium sp. SH661]|uniref:hypothetical protein n=1 Tax=Planctomicrobium sp. SH661 TaxID=3448124 RepID=UPI003F5C3B25